MNMRDKLVMRYSSIPFVTVRFDNYIWDKLTDYT